MRDIELVFRCDLDKCIYATSRCLEKHSFMQNGVGWVCEHLKVTAKEQKKETEIRQREKIEKLKERITQLEENRSKIEVKS